jgi:hypothetical protein
MPFLGWRGGLILYRAIGLKGKGRGFDAIRLAIIQRHGRAWPGHPRLKRKNVDARLKTGHDATKYEKFVQPRMVSARVRLPFPDPFPIRGFPCPASFACVPLLPPLFL